MSDRVNKTKLNSEDSIRKHLNALKHGVFSPITILPGEDPQEFSALHSETVKEWAPIGPTEEDAVLSIVKGIWRKGRLQKFLWAKVIASQIDASHPAYDEIAALRGFSGVLEFAPDCLDELLSCRFLSRERKEHLKRKFPPEDFETTLAHARAIQKEINSVILPSLERCEKPLEVYCLQAADILPPDDFKNEIALEERIDAMIDRAVKRLVQAKAAKEMLRTSSPQGSGRTPEQRVSTRQ